MTEINSEVSNEISSKKSSNGQFVNRIFYVEEETKSAYRIITVTYIYDRLNKVLSYGACIYKDDGTSISSFCKKTHRETALQRLNKCPVIINSINDDESVKNFHEKIRLLIYKYGVKGKKLN